MWVDYYTPHMHHVAGSFYFPPPDAHNAGAVLACMLTPAFDNKAWPAATQQAGRYVCLCQQVGCFEQLGLVYSTWRGQ